MPQQTLFILKKLLNSLSNTSPRKSDGWTHAFSLLLRRVGLGFQPVVINVACAFGATSFLRAASSLLQADLSLLRADSSLLQADLSLLRADSSLTARGTVSLPPEGRQVYRPRDGRFTARGAVSNESAGKSDEP